MKSQTVKLTYTVAKVSKTGETEDTISHWQCLANVLADDQFAKFKICCKDAPLKCSAEVTAALVECAEKDLSIPASGVTI